MALSLADLKTANSDELLALVKRRHPEYKDNLEHWKFLELSYKGGRKWIEKNIWSYHKEGKKEFAERKKRAYRFPHSREVISLVNKYVFKGAIDRSEKLPPHIKSFWGSATLLKRPIADLMEDLSTKTSTFGRIWVVVDNNLPDNAVTVADQRASKGRCYAYPLTPEQALDFAFDEDGELSWFLNSEFVRDDENPLKGDGKLKERYRIWTKEFTGVIEVDGRGGSQTAVFKDEKEYDLGIVPIFPADNVSSENVYTSQGLIEDVAYMDRTVANYLSNLDVIILDQTFSQLVIPYQGMMQFDNGAEENDEDIEVRQNIITMGTKRVFAYNAEGGSAPQYISPDVGQPQLILGTVTKIIGEIYHSIGMAGERTKEDNATGIDNSSGVAKAYDFERLNAMLAAKARSLQHIERNLVRIVNAWNSDVKELEDTEELVSYPTTFDVRNLADEMDNAQRLSLVNAPKTIRRKQMGRLAHKMFPQAPKEEMDEIKKDIEEEWLEEPDLPVGAPGAGGQPAINRGRVPGKDNSQGENNKGSVKADDKE